MNWNDDAVAKLTEMWNAGASVSTIGKVLGCNKNQVIGKAHRLKLDGRASPIKGERKVKPVVVRSTSETHDYTGERSFMDLAPRQCQFAVNSERPFAFCAKPVAEDRPYCPQHCKTCYQPSRPRGEPENDR